MAPTAGMIRYNTDTKRLERSTDGGGTWAELDLTGELLIPTPAAPAHGSVGQTAAPYGTAGNVNNLVLPNSRHQIVELTQTANFNITGIAVAGKTNGDIVEFHAFVNSGVVIGFPHASASSSAGNQFVNPATSMDTPITARGWARFVWNSNSGYWWMQGHEQGRGIDYTPTSSPQGGGTLSSPPFVVARYTLKGRILFLTWKADFIPSGTITSVLITLPGGAVTSGTMYAPAIITTGAAATMGRLSRLAGLNTISFDMINSAGAPQTFGGGVNSMQTEFWVEVE